MSATRITGKEYPVKDILCNKFIMRIPNYQRPYAWGTEQVQTLLEDLLNALGDPDDHTDDREAYFLGSIVLVKDEHSPDADVVDGQQRLTTLTILMAVIRAALENQKLRDQITEMIFSPEKILLGEKASYFLTLREKDREFFQKYIQEDELLEKLSTADPNKLTQSQINIIKNARLLQTMLSKYTQGQLVNLVRYISNNCYLIIVTTPTTDSAHRIFSVLNDRGLDLSYTDICKAELIGAIGSRQPELEDAYTQKWEDAEEQIGREGFKDLFSHIRTILLKARLKDTILKELRNSVFPKYEGRPTAFIDDVLLPYKNAYDVIKTFSYQNDNLSGEVNGILRWLRWIDNSDWLPVAMLAYQRYSHDSAKFLSILKHLERLAASLTISRANVNTRQTRYNEVLTWIEQGKDWTAPDSPLQLSPAEIVATLNLLQGDIYNSGARGYILRRLNGLLSEDKTTPDTPIFTIEHVLPQNPSANSRWLQWYPDEKERLRITQTLGNLALLSKRKNSAAGNSDFETKKNQYFVTPVTQFALTTSIIRESDWTRPVYERRQAMLVNLLKVAWRLDSPENRN